MSSKVSNTWGLKVGNKVRCTRSSNPWWTEGKLYQVVDIYNDGNAIIIDDDGDRIFPELNPHRFETAEKGD